MRRKTDEEFKQEVYDLVDKEYVFLEPYQGVMTKIKVRHERCGNIYKVSPNNFLKGNRCPYCRVEDKTKNNTQFQQEIHTLVGDEYTFLDEYVNAKTKLRVKHNGCGNTYEVQPSNFLNGSRCPFCFGNHKKTDDEFQQEVFDLVDNEYVFLEPYQGALTKIKVRHERCGNTYEVSPNNFLKGDRCPYCYGKIKRTDEEFKQEVYNLVGNEYVFLEPYQGALTKIKVRHERCGNTYEVSPNKFICGNRCPYCSNEGKRKTDEQFKQEVYNLVGDEYSFLEHYQGALTKIKVKHDVCGNIYGVRPSDFIHGKRCPYCNAPKGETIINKILDTLNLSYETQQTFDDLKDKLYLSYDFYIPSQNILIEYQGIQHYAPVDIFGGEDAFISQQKHDQMKLDYAKENGYNLIAVPYTEDTLSKIKKYLIKHGLKK